MHAAKIDGAWRGHQFDPNGQTGPVPTNRLHINSVSCDDNGLTFAGLRTQGLIGLAPSSDLKTRVSLPEGVHNAVLTDNGVIFNDTAANFLRYVTRDGVESRFPFPTYDESDIEFAGIDDSKIARQGFGRGLCRIDERLVAAGSSPSTVSVFDIVADELVFSVNFSMDIRNAVHGLEVWPFSLPV